MADRGAQRRYDETAGEDQPSPAGEPEQSLFQRVRAVAELLSFVAVVFTLPFALLDYHEQHTADVTDRKSKADSTKQQQIDAAKDAYRQVDQRFADYVKLCLDHPRLDCYSVPQKVDLTPDEVVQQKVLFATLSDVFQNAYQSCHRVGALPEVQSFHDKQWAKWDVYIKKFAARPSYRQAWLEVRDEHQDGFVGYMDGLIPPAAR